MVRLVVNNMAGVVNGKAPPSDLGLAKNKGSSGNGNDRNGNGVAKAAVGNGGSGRGGQGGGNGGTAAPPRKLTKNEKRRQKNKQRKAQAVEGAVVEKSMAESNGVAVASWPPPPAPKEEASDVQVGVLGGFVPFCIMCMYMLSPPSVRGNSCFATFTAAAVVLSGELLCLFSCPSYVPVCGTRALAPKGRRRQALGATGV